MKTPLDDAALNTLFREARSYNRWAPDPVSVETLHALYELLKFGPTATNSTPARFVFVKGAEAKAKLLACVSPGNVVRTPHSSRARASNRISYAHSAREPRNIYLRGCPACPSRKSAKLCDGCARC